MFALSKVRLKIRWWQHRVGSSPTTGTTSEWTMLHSKSPAKRLGFSYAAPSFLLFPGKPCFAGFPGGPGISQATYRLRRFFSKNHRALILLPHLGLSAAACAAVGLEMRLRAQSLPRKTLLRKFLRGPRKNKPCIAFGPFAQNRRACFWLLCAAGKDVIIVPLQ